MLGRTITRYRNLLTTLAAVVLATTARGQASGTFPGEPFNGMQITYSITGANVSKTTDTPGFTWRRVLEGSLGNGELRVTGKATLTAGWSYTLHVTVQAGNKTKSVDFDKKVNEQADFDVAVPILNTAVSGSVTIAMEGVYNAGGRGVVISASLSQMAPIVIDKKPPPGNLSASARLKMILDRFMNGIKPGNFGSGWMNNIASWLPFTSRFDSSICGNYQAQTLAILDAIRWSPDPNVRSLLDGYDYGPIQSLYGGHQAVVIYPKGKDWMTDGIVLDPWIEQHAKYYAAQEWAQMYSFGAGSYYGIGGSQVYEGSHQYPTVGGSYVNPNAKTLTSAEQEWVRTLPQVDRDKLKAITDPNLRQMVIKNGFINRKLTGIMVVNCPVEVSVVNISGQTTGFTDRGFESAASGAVIDRVTKGRGDWLTIVRFDPTQGFRARLQATGQGPVEIVVGHGMDVDERIASRYGVQVRSGESIGLGIARPKGNLQVDRGVSIPPSPLFNPANTANPAKPQLIFDNNNKDAVQNGPTSIQWLTFDRDVYVTQIETYHWNGGSGSTVGTISIVEKTSGRVIGSWKATGSPGMNGIPNVVWTVNPNLQIPKGTYRIEVSSPETWAYNSQSKVAGFVRIWARSP